MNIDDIALEGKIVDTIIGATKDLDPDKLKTKDLKNVMAIFGFPFSQRVLDYGREQGYFPQGEQKTYRATRYYSRQDIFALVAVLFMKRCSFSNYINLVKLYKLNDPKTAVAFLKKVDYFSQEKRAVKLQDIPERLERLARSTILLLSKKIQADDWYAVVSSIDDVQQDDVDYNALLLEDYLGDFRKKLYRFIDVEIKKIALEYNKRKI